jgi:drug/metabolite transporter (DMT)-like permease
MGISVGLWYMIGSAFFFSLMTLAVKLVGRRIPSQEVVLVRGSLNVAFSYLLLRRAGVRPWGNRPLPLTLRGFLGFGSLSCLYFAVVRLPLADATVLQYTSPMWTAFLAVWVLGEHMQRREVLFAAASAVGVVVITRPSFLFGAGAPRLDLIAVAAALAGALFSSGAYVTVRKLGRTEHPLVIVFYFTLVTVPASLPGALAHLVAPTAREWLILLAVGVAAQAGQLYLTHGLQLERAGRATAAGYLQVVFAALWGALFFAELPDRWTIGGSILVLAGTLGLAISRTHGGGAIQAPGPSAGIDPI